MTYDAFGNILRKNGVVYEYDSVWKDRLVKVGDETITYDESGYPTNYRGFAATWQNGRMTSFGTNAYTYNCNGIRTSKTVNSVEHTYTLEGSRIVCEKWAEHELIPMYDATGNVYGILYDNSSYFFMRNLQGDVLSVMDKDGNAVAEYSYDAWGKCTILSDTSGCDIASVNPFRYRGYYYDAETELYYLNSRYYDAEIGRFISADDIGYLAPETIGGVNLYAYCVNNPITNMDKTGHFAISLTLLGFIIGVAVGAAVGGYIAYDVAKDSGATGWDLVGWTVLGIVGGGIVGGALGAGLGSVITKATGILGLSIIKGNVFVITETMVLGHYGYAALGASLGYGYYEISQALYNSMTDVQRWAMNSQFLYDCYKLGANFIVEPNRVIAPLGIEKGSWLYYEIEYLLEKGYLWLEDLSALVK